MFTDYAECEIEIQPRKGKGFPLSIHAPGGDARGTLRLPTSDPVYQELASRLAVLFTDETILSQLGQILFNALFQGQVKEVYTRSQGTLKAGQGLRIVLNIAATEQEVAVLPWEFMYDPDQGPLALLDAPVVRYLPQPTPIPNLQTQLPLKVLLTSAQTPPTINVERELNEVRTALTVLGESVQTIVEPHLTPSKLQQLLRQGVHVWHFVGHGALNKEGTAGRLVFEDGSGGLNLVSAQQLGILLNRSGVRLVVLDACESARLATDPFQSMAPALIRAQIPAIVAMQFKVPERAARAFAVEFYRALVGAFPIDACVTEGRKAVMNTTGLDNPDWGIPVVYTRAPDGKLFELPPTTPTAPTKTVGERPQVNKSTRDENTIESAAHGSTIDTTMEGRTRDMDIRAAYKQLTPVELRTRLRQFLLDHFNESEMRDLCFELGIIYEDLGGQTRADKVRELVLYCERHQLLDDLIMAATRLHPNVDWTKPS